MEAAGFASAIITFVEFSYKLVNGSITAYESGTGLVDQDVTRVVNDLEAATKAIDVTPIATSSGPHWAELRELALGCNALSNDLTLILQKARRRQDGNRALRSFGAAWASLRSSKDVMEIQRQLNEYRAQILLRLSLILDGRQQWIAKQLEELHTGNARYFRETVVEFKCLQSTIKELESRLSKQALEDQRDYDPKQDHSDSLAEIHAELSRISAIIASGNLKNAATDVLERLRFETMYSRVDHIGDGEFQLFSWLFDDDHEVDQVIDGESSGDEESSFIGEYGDDEIAEEARQAALVSITEWLEVGGKVLHISGKAGAGKSTLMKRLCLDSGLKKKLEGWSGDKTLVMATFFFWGTGDSQQNSLEGLYRSLLYELLMKYPELTCVAFPETTALTTTSTPFRMPELRQALANLIEAEKVFSDHHFCFFIDGLDEYNGDAADHINLAQQLRRWAGFSNVKICASSRPHAEFHSTFDEATRICLHKLTASDIEHFAYKAFRNSPGVHMNQGQLKEIARAVVGQADGVFLWVRLAIPALLGHVQYATDESEVLSELCRLPSDLNQLFTRLFDSISASQRTRAYRLLLIVKERGESNAIALSWVDDLKDAGFPFNQSRWSCSEDEAVRRVAQVEHQLKILCKGLLELRKTIKSHEYFKHMVRFMHRSVRDFLDHEDTMSTMLRHLGDSYDVILDVQRLKLAEFKFARWDLRYFDLYNMDRMENRDLCQVFHATLDGSPAVLDELEAVLDSYRSEVANKIKASPQQSEYYHLLSKETPDKAFILWGTFAGHQGYDHSREYPAQCDVSFPHCLASKGQLHGVVDRLKRDSAENCKRKGLCLFISAFMTREPRVMIQGLLDAGVQINNEVSLWAVSAARDDNHQYAPFWVVVAHIMVFETYFRFINGSRLDAIHSGLELLLRAGVAPQADIWIEFDDHGEPVFFTFEDFIVLCRPPNLDVLIRELRRLSWSGWAARWMSRAASLWLPGTAILPSIPGPRPREYHIRDFDWQNEDTPALRRIWMGADKFNVGLDILVRSS